MAVSSVMGRGSRIAIVLVTAALVAAGVAGAVQNDAGSGGDAAGSPEKAHQLKSFGRYSGNFTSSEKVDWYKIKVQAKSKPTCLAIATSASEALSAHLVTVTTEDKTREVRATVKPDRVPFLAVASSSFRGAFLHAEAAAISTAELSPYEFVIDARTPGELGPGDAATGGDVGGTMSAATDITSACTGGVLDPAAGDTKDVYRFSGVAGDRVVVSISSDTGTLRANLRTATGELLATIGGKDLQATTLATTGDYYVSITDASATPMTTSYVLASCTVNCGPPEEPCDPACITTLESTTSS